MLEQSTTCHSRSVLSKGTCRNYNSQPLQQMLRRSQILLATFVISNCIHLYASCSFLQDEATRRLASVYRSALRLLQKYQDPGHTSQPLPPEFSLLLQQLSLLSQHFGVGGANDELDTTVKVLQVSVQYEVLWVDVIKWTSV